MKRTRLKIVPYRSDYVDAFSYCGSERKFFSSDEEVREAIKERAQKEGETVVGLLDGKVLLITGIYLLGPQVGEAWIFLNPPPRKMVRPICKDISDLLQSRAKRMNLVRLQSLCLPLEQTKGFLEFLGFELEAVLHNYYSGILDALMYTILWRERCQD